MIEKLPTRDQANITFLGSLVLFVIEICSLCVPALINTSPLVYPDTRSYFLGGRAAVDKIASLFSNGGGSGSALTATVQKARGVRSAFYALFTYIPTVTVSLWLVIVLQAIIVAAILRLVFRLGCPNHQKSHRTAFIVVLALLTTVSWATCNVMPDIFTSIMALSITIVIVYWNELSASLIAWLTLTIAGALVMHITNLPIAVGLLLVGYLIIGSHTLNEGARYLVVIGALTVGVAAMMLVGVVGFHQWSIAPQSPPFLLARSLQDGPGKLYLLEHCPQIGLDMCNHLDKLDQPTEKFIWDNDGVYSAASPEEEARLRAEDKRIYLAAALEHPWMQAQAMAANAFRQLITFSIHEYYIPSWADYTSSEMTLHMPDQAPWQTYVSIAEYVVVVGSLGFIGVMWWRRPGPTRNLPPALKQLSIMVVATIVLEAAAGAISEPVPRYEARVIWMIPMAALLIWAANRRTNID